MTDAFPTVTPSSRSVLALSLVGFAVAGAANTPLETMPRSAIAVGFTVAGVYGLARYARRVSRRRLARLSMELWIAFLGVAGAHLFGPETIAAAVPGRTGAVLTILEGATWTTLLGATASTAFLGLREYGARRGAETPEAAEDRGFDGDVDY